MDFRQISLASGIQILQAAVTTLAPEHKYILYMLIYMVLITGHGYLMEEQKAVVCLTHFFTDQRRFP